MDNKAARMNMEPDNCQFYNSTYLNKDRKLYFGHSNKAVCNTAAAKAGFGDNIAAAMAAAAVADCFAENKD